MNHRHLVATVAVVATLAAAPPTASVAATDGFGLENGQSTVSWFGYSDDFWPRLQITISPGSGTVTLAGEVAFTTDHPIDEGGWYSSAEVTGTVSGTFDESTGMLEGTATFTERAHHQQEVPEFESQYDKQQTTTLSGTLSGQITSGSTTVTVRFDGTNTRTATGTYQNGRPIDDLDRTQAWVEDVTFDVVGTPPPSTEIQAVVSDVVGTVSYSPATEAELEPAQRSWIRLRAGDRVPLEAGVMLRSGPDGTAVIRLGGGSLMRLTPSTLLSIQPPPATQTPMSVVYGRLWEGLAQFWWESGTDGNLEIETDRANTSIQGTHWQISTSDEATQVSVFDGTVGVTDVNTGSALALTAGRTATLDDSGMNVASNEELGILAPEQPAETDTDGALPAADEDGSSSSTTYVLIGGAVVVAIVVAWRVLVRVRSRRDE